MLLHHAARYDVARAIRKATEGGRDLTDMLCGLEQTATPEH
jgi:hypothetical protein